MSYQLRSAIGNEAMHGIPKFKLFLAGALVWVAGVAFALSALAGS